MKKIAIIAVLVAVLVAGLVVWVVVPNMTNRERFNLDSFGWLTVDSVGRGALVFQKAPRGEFLFNHKFNTGDQIYVNLEWREGGYAIAYDNGEYGYVDASYIDWGDESTTAYETGEYVGRMQVVNCDEWVSLRVRPSTSSDRIAEVTKGAEVEAHYYDKLWMKCDFDGQEGYILSEYLEIIGDDGNTEATEEGEVTEEGKATEEDMNTD